MYVPTDGHFRPPSNVTRSTRSKVDTQKIYLKVICNYFWATICKTVRPMWLVLSSEMNSPYAIGPLSVLSVMLVYCGQMVGWIEMKLGTQVGLGPSHIALDGDNPIFGPCPLWMD